MSVRDWTRDDRLRLSEHFRISELACPCGCVVPVRARERLLLLTSALERIREAFGQPVIVMSGYRCPGHNRTVGGVSGSEHTDGTAADLFVGGKTGEEIRGVLERMIAAGEIPEGGLGTYSDPRRILICHYDQRGARARWRTRAARVFSAKK